MRTMQSELNKINGNVMAWLADKQIDSEYEEGLRGLRRKCEGCGISESYYKNVIVNIQLTDGLCNDCLGKAKNAKA